MKFEEVKGVKTKGGGGRMWQCDGDAQRNGLVVMQEQSNRHKIQHVGRWRGKVIERKGEANSDEI